MTAEAAPASLRELVLDFLVDHAGGSARASEISQHLLCAWSSEDVWHIARANPHLFQVGEGDHEIPPDERVVRLTVGGRAA
jgi:hypothetical protein